MEKIWKTRKTLHYILYVLKSVFIMLSYLLKMLGDIISIISHNSQLIDYTFTFLHISLKVGDISGMYVCGFACALADWFVFFLLSEKQQTEDVPYNFSFGTFWIYNLMLQPILFSLCLIVLRVLIMSLELKTPNQAGH